MKKSRPEKWKTERRSRELKRNPVETSGLSEDANGKDDGKRMRRDKKATKQRRGTGRSWAMDSHRPMSWYILRCVSEMDRQGGDGRRRSCCQQKASPDDDDNEPPTHLSAVSLPLFTLAPSAFVSLALSLFSSTLLHLHICIKLWYCSPRAFCEAREDTCASVVTFVGAENTIISLSCLCLCVRLCCPLCRPSSGEKKKIYRSQACCDKNKQWAKKKKMKLLNTR